MGKWRTIPRFIVFLVEAVVGFALGYFAYMCVAEPDGIDGMGFIGSIIALVVMSYIVSVVVNFLFSFCLNFLTKYDDYDGFWDFLEKLKWAPLMLYWHILKHLFMTIKCMFVGCGYHYYNSSPYTYRKNENPSTQQEKTPDNIYDDDEDDDEREDLPSGFFSSLEYCLETECPFRSTLISPTNCTYSINYRYNYIEVSLICEADSSYVNSDNDLRSWYDEHGERDLTHHFKYKVFPKIVNEIKEAKGQYRWLDNYKSVRADNVNIYVWSESAREWFKIDRVLPPINTNTGNI